MSRSAFTQAISALEMSAAKNGQSRSISRSSSTPCVSRAVCSAVPSPNQAGSTARACVHEKTHGIARKSSMRIVALALGRARAELQARDLAHGRRGVEEVGEVLVAVDELAVGGGRDLGHLRDDGLEALLGARARGRPSGPAC